MKTVVGICDDNLAAIHEIEAVVKEYEKECQSAIEIRTFLDGREVLEKIEEIDMLFLDIEMPEIDGIETGRMIRCKNSKCVIIMATSKVERFKEAFKIGAFRFVSKPFDKDEIKEALIDAQNTFAGQECMELYCKRKSYMITQREIVIVKSYGSYVTMLVNKQWYRKDLSMAEVESLLDSRIFYKIDKKHIVNMLHIENYCKDEILVENEKYKIARRRKNDFETAYIEFEKLYGGVRW